MAAVTPGSHDRSSASPSDLAQLVTASPLLSAVPGISHGLTCRVAGLGRADGNVGYSPPRDAEDAWAMRQVWCEAIGVDPERLATAGQVHGADVLRVSVRDAGKGARPGSGRVGLADALIADEPGVVLMTLHADCLPILLVDPIRPAVAAIHAGWRGTVADVAGATVRAMEAEFGTERGRTLAFLGPTICDRCYDVGDDVAALWSESGGAIEGPLLRRGARWHFDLKSANLALLARAGVLLSHCDSYAGCTRCDGDRWFSHRGQGATTGRFGAIVSLIG
jgi:YfiH family protein